MELPELTPEAAATPYEVATREDLIEAERKVLAKVGLTREEVLAQGRRGRFDHDGVHQAWFVVSTVVDALRAHDELGLP